MVRARRSNDLMTPAQWSGVLDDMFDDWWITLAEQGMCDGFGGAEYERVRREWADAGFPSPIPFFIERQANRPAEM